MRKILIILITIVFCLTARISYPQELMEGFKPYIIKKGDTLSKIAPPAHWNIIQRLNRIDEKRLVPGKKILIPEDFEKAVWFCPVPKRIFNQNFKKILYFFLDIQYFGAYQDNNLWLWGPISSGKLSSKTPSGEFLVLWKNKNYISKKYKVPMHYAVNFSEKGYFFHHQSLPGKPASHGCIRLLKVDAEKLFYWIGKNDPVIITDLKKQLSKSCFFFYF